MNEVIGLHHAEVEHGEEAKEYPERGEGDFGRVGAAGPEVEGEEDDYQRGEWEHEVREAEGGNESPGKKALMS